MNVDVVSVLKVFISLFYFFLPWRLPLTHLVAVSRVTTFSFEICHVWHRILFVSMATKPPKSQLNIRCSVRLKEKWRNNFGEFWDFEIAHVLYPWCSMSSEGTDQASTFLYAAHPCIYWSLSTGQTGWCSIYLPPVMASVFNLCTFVPTCHSLSHLTAFSLSSWCDTASKTEGAACAFLSAFSIPIWPMTSF